jgi:hypothetical protein
MTVTYVERMCWRMIAPCVLPAFIAVAMAYAVSGVVDLLMVATVAPTWSVAPLLIVCAGVLLSVLLLSIQMFRLWRWQHGAGETCFVCSCLLGHERAGRWGPYRKCQGCGKNHSTAAQLA